MSHYGYPSERQGEIDFIKGVAQPNIHAAAMIFHSVPDARDLHTRHAIAHELSLMKKEKEAALNNLKAQWGPHGSEVGTLPRSKTGLEPTAPLILDAKIRCLDAYYQYKAFCAVQAKLARAENSNPYVEAVTLNFGPEGLQRSFNEILTRAEQGLGGYHPLNNNCATGFKKALDIGLPEPTDVGGKVAQFLHNFFSSFVVNPLAVPEALKRRGVASPSTSNPWGVDRTACCC